MKELNSVDKGDASEAAVISKLKKMGKTVLIPFGDNQRYDIVVDDGNTFTRVQIKTAREVEDGKIVFDTAGKHTNTKGTIKKPYDNTEIDEFMAYEPDRDSVYRVPVSEAPNTTMTLRHNAKQKQSSINWAKDYQL